MDLDPVLGRPCSALHLPGFRAIDVVGRNPLCVVSSSRGNSRATSTLDRRSLGLLGRTRWLLRALSRLALLGEVRRNPDRVEEVNHATKTGQEDKVEEEAIAMLVFPFTPNSNEMHYDLHVRVEDVGFRFNNANSSVVGVDSEEVALSVGNNGGQSQSQVLRVHLVHEAVGQFLLLTSGNLDVVSRGSQVADYGALFLARSR